MYLKKIEATGFKSFANTTVINLEKGITGVVGPNGSGKSNIVDAVRWVLGEQSVKSLRGTNNMTDVIFSGTTNRAEKNIATVILTLDNSDRYIPLNTDEIELKRRVYRDGTNEYFINNEKTRLKDITGLLLDTGIAKESFNIISQGNIEEILNSKPVDRRVIFEEAAGVLKYKRRKEEAIKKLDKTKSNISRVDDIIEELEKRIEPLKKQRVAALKYQDLSDDFKTNEITVITADITSLSDKYKTKKTEIDKLKEELASLESTSTVSESKLETHKLDLMNLNIEITASNKELLELTSLSEQLNGERKLIIERMDNKKDEKETREKILLLKDKELTNNSLTDNLLNELNSINLNIKTLKESISIKESKLAEIFEDKNKINNILTKKVKEEMTLNSKINLLKNRIEQHESFPLAVSKILNNDRLYGIHNTVANIIEFNEEYKDAIGTALGYNSNNLIVEDDRSAKEAITYLKTNKLGRATFLPLTNIKPRYIDQSTINLIKNIDGFISIASNLVKTTASYQDIINSLLGNVIIAENINAATIIAKQINNRFKIVTLDGNVINPGGSYTGGQTLTRQNSINDKFDLENSITKQKELTKEIKEKENIINEIDHKLKTIEDEIYLVKKDLYENNELFLVKEERLKELNNSKTNLTKEIKSLNSVVNNTLKEEEQKSLDKYYEVTNQLLKITNNIKELDKNKSNLENLIDEEQYLSKQGNKDFLIKTKEINNLEIKINRYDVSLDTLINNLNETYSMTYEHAFKNYILLDDLDELRNKVSSIKKQIKELGPINMESISEFDEVNERYTFLSVQREDLFDASNSLTDIIASMDTVMVKDFKEVFDIINTNFKIVFKELFKGGKAELILTEPNNLLETGIEIKAEPPGKKLTSINLLSGGEKTFTAISLLFAILKSRPVPFCILDEIESALDEVNVENFGNYITNLKDKTQFILITHKKKTMEFADVLYGVTMQESGVSSLVSVKLTDIVEDNK